MTQKLTFDDNYAYLDGKHLDNSFIFVSRGCWFAENTVCWLDANCGRQGGIFVGGHLIDSEIDAKNRSAKIGDIVFDGELCRWDEFDIYDGDRSLICKGVEAYE